MGIRAMQTAGTGMQAMMFQLDTIANNLANSGTTAFKRTRGNFEDLFYEHLKLAGSQDSAGKLSPIGIHVGLGTRIAGTAVDHRQGSLIQTGKELDLAITGDGFFPVQDGAEVLYTRAGTFTLNADGDIVLGSANRGRLIEPALTIPQDALSISISSEGVVSVLQPGSSTQTQVGTIQTARFVNVEGLMARGENLYAESEASGTALLGNPGLEGRGTIQQGFLETSNVEPVRELVDLIKTQRNFEMNSQAIQASDQMLQLIANIRRG